MHTRLIGVQVKQPIQLCLRDLNESVLSLGVGSPHSTQVPLVVTLGQEARQDGLLKNRGRPPCSLSHCLERRDEILRHHDVGQAQAREQRLAERPQVEDSLVGIDALQSYQNN